MELFRTPKEFFDDAMKLRHTSEMDGAVPDMVAQQLLKMLSVQPRETARPSNRICVRLAARPTWWPTM